MRRPMQKATRGNLSRTVFSVVAACLLLPFGFLAQAAPEIKEKKPVFDAVIDWIAKLIAGEEK